MMIAKNKKSALNRKPAIIRKETRDFVYLLSKYVKPYWKVFLFLLITSFLATFLAALSPMIMAPILDIALGKTAEATTVPPEPVTFKNLDLSNMGDMVFLWIGSPEDNTKFRLVLILCVVYAITGLLNSLAKYVSYLLALYIRVRAAQDIQFDMFDNILIQPLTFFTKQYTGELMSRLEKDTLETTNSFDAIIVKTITSPILILFYGWLMIRTSPKLIFAVIIAIILNYIINRAIQNPVKQTLTEHLSALANLSARLQETIVNIRIVKSFGGKNFELRKLKEQMKITLRTNMRSGVFKHIHAPLRGTVGYFIEAGVLLIATSDLLSGQLTTSAFFLFIYVGRAIMLPVTDLVGVFISIKMMMAASKRIFELLLMRPQLQDGSKHITEFKHQIRFNNVTFSYGENIILDNINLEIDKGQVVALVGPSGAGKSTLVDLALRFYDPIEGNIVIDGQNLQELRQTDYIELFGTVTQNPLLFNATISDNIVYNRENINRDDIIRAAKIANAHDFITNELPQGYDTIVGERGIRLSGGQRQRIALARAVAASPQILILDEATSALDSQSERLVQEAIDRVIESSTAIVIAHRLSTIVRADKIMVLDGGRILDQGNHNELLQRCELYKKLCQLQFGIADKLV